MAQSSDHAVGNEADDPVIVVLIVLAVGNAALLAIVSIFGVEVLASLLPRQRRLVTSAERPSVAVIVPAHEEEDGIAETVRNIAPQMQPGDRLIVVADNCTDETAVRARDAGAEVIERHDAERRGKGYALDFGVRHLQADPPAVVVFIDADCTITPGTLDVLATAAASGGRPAQGRYLLRAPHGAGVGLRVAELAFLVKNQVRPAGLGRLGLPCHLTGSGMGFPWQVIAEAQLANASLVEDMKLGLDLALAGAAPLYCPDGRINSVFPLSAAGAASQRTRWEEGHLGMTRLALGYLGKAVVAGQFGACALALDMLVPPLTLLLLLAGLAFVLTGVLTVWLALPMLAFVLATISMLVLLFSIAMAWLVFGRKVLPARSLTGIAPYVLRKIGLYGGLAAGKRSRGWVRTDRNGPEA